MRLSAIVNSIKSQETIDSYQLIPRVKRRWNGKSIIEIQNDIVFKPCWT